LFLWDDTLPGFGVRIYPSGKRVYVFQYRTKDRRPRRATIGQHGPLTAEKAREIAHGMYHEVRKGGDPAGDIYAARRALTMAELCDRYLAEHAIPRKKSRSVDLDRNLINRFVRPRLGNLKVQHVGRQDVGKLHRSLTRTPYQANHVLILLSKMMNLAERWGLRPDGSNPCRHVDRFPQRRRERFLSQAELAALAQVLSEGESSQTELAAVVAAIRLLVFTGARLSEIVTLRWDYVDAERQYLRLPDSKTGAKTIYLSPPALEVLAGIKRERDNPYVIAGTKAGAHLVNLEKPWRRIRARTTVRLWAQDPDSRVSGLVARLTGDLDREPTALECRAAAEKAEIDLPPGLLHVRLHDLRHSFASMAAAGGLSLLMIGALLGHTQYQTTKRYTHLVGDPLRQAADTVGRRIAAAMKGDGGEVVDLAGSSRGAG
jgi:integrase